jgi:hypothetical protein
MYRVLFLFLRFRYRNRYRYRYRNRYRYRKLLSAKHLDFDRVMGLFGKTLCHVSNLLHFFDEVIYYEKDLKLHVENFNLRID